MRFHPTPHHGVLGFSRYIFTERETQFALMGGALTLLTLSLVGLVPAVATTAGYVAGIGVAAYPIARSGINNLIFNRSFFSKRELLPRHLDIPGVPLRGGPQPRDTPKLFYDLLQFFRVGEG